MDIRRFQAPPDGRFKLSRYDPGDHGNLNDKHAAERLLAKGIDRLRELQEKLYAQDRWSVLLILQALDAAGKDGAIEHVMSGVNPQGCTVVSFKRPSDEEQDHDYLWRAVRALPPRGEIGIFNRSYYEEVLVVRVHEDVFAQEKLPPALVTKRIWKERFEDIRNFEAYLSRNGCVVRKVFLHVSRDEQRRRLLARIDDPQKRWKFQEGDLKERGYWKQYMAAYDDAIRETTTKAAPWYVVPADHKWYARLVIAQILIDTLDGLSLAYPAVDRQRRRVLEGLRKTLT